MRVLILTNYLQGYTGSEIVALEIAECFGSAGHPVMLCAHHVGEILRREAALLPNTEVRSSCELRDFDFDFIWSQHHVLASLPGFLLQPVDACFRVFFHLSTNGGLESPLPAIEDHYAHVVMANSPETQDHLARYGLPQTVRLFPNPAPRRFRMSSAHPNLERLLVLSNHMPLEVEQALRELQRLGVQIRLIGIQGEYRRTDESDFVWSDAVLTIGKSVQYAVLAHRPVFCYDIFGGPGWLVRDNFERARFYNFSGRCTRQRKSASAITREIVEGFSNAHAFASTLDVGDEFELEWQIGKLMAEHRGGLWRGVLQAPTDANAADLRRVTALASILCPSNPDFSADGEHSQDELRWLKMEARWTAEWVRLQLDDDMSSGPLSRAQKLFARVVGALKGHTISTLSDAKGHSIVPVGGTEVGVFKGTMSIRSDSADPGFIFCVPEAVCGCDYLLFLVFENNAHRDTFLQVFYRFTSFQPFSEERSRRFDITAGPNSLSLAVSGSSLQLGIRIDPGDKPGGYVFHRLDVVAI